MGWIGNAFAAMLGFVPVYFATGLLDRHYNIRSDVTAVLWMAGISATLATFIVVNGRGGELVLGKPHFAMLALAATIGSLANFFLFKSLSQSPNPGLTVAIVHTDALLTFLLAVPLAMLLPNYFTRPEIRVQDIIGVLAVMVGITLITIRK